MKIEVEWKKIFWLVGVFAVCFALPLEWSRFQDGLAQGLALARWYAREHVMLCLVPAFFIAGAIATFVRQDAVMSYLGPKAPKPVAYGVASVSGGILAVCSCTVLPLFAGIWRMGAGLGPAVTFLYSGPAISALAVILTARILGLELGLARAVGAVAFAVVIGLVTAWIFRKSEMEKSKVAAELPDPGPPSRPLWQTVTWIGLMVALLVFANWSEADDGGVFGLLARLKWVLVAASGLGMAAALVAWFGATWFKVLAVVGAVSLSVFATPQNVLVPFAVGTLGLVWIAVTTGGELGEWWTATWDFTKMIAPLLLAGVFVSGFLLGQPGHEALIPSEWIASAVGGNGILAVAFSSVVGALMYFATLTEIPILQGLLGSGMGKGPALALLLAGPALSLPNLLALGKIFGAKRTFVYSLLVVIMSTLAGWIYGNLIP
jgi:uncharacterized membrane protein YraQ (UPF0718 family)